MPAAVDEALQHGREQLRRARADGLISLPRAVTGDVQPGRVFLEGEFVDLGAGPSDGLSGRLLRLALRRLEVAVGSSGGLLERLALIVAKAFPDGLGDDHRTERHPDAVAAERGELGLLGQTEAHEGLER